MNDAIKLEQRSRMNRNLHVLVQYYKLRATSLQNCEDFVQDNVHGSRSVVHHFQYPLL